MQYISFHAKTIVTPDTPNHLPLEAEVNHGVGETAPASIPPVRFDHDMNVRDREFLVVDMEPIEEYLVVEPKPTAWEVLTAWTGAVAGSWALVIGCVMIARALLP